MIVRVRVVKELLVNTLKMTFAQVVETPVINSSSFQNYPHLDDHTIRTTGTPGLKPFTKSSYSYKVTHRWHGLLNIVTCYGARALISE